jgi:two-component system, OmpR family, alkaline phosphatase synthesis response regulator PhoP
VTLLQTARILLVEDEPALVITLTDMLKGEGYQVASSTNGLEAKNRIARETFDLVILDVMLPGMNGFEVCKRVRELGYAVPILMLTARGQTSDKVRGLRTGADDYLAKPFDPHELLARIEALLRRVPEQNRSSDWQEFGDIRLDLQIGRVFRSGRKVDLSEREMALLKYLIDRRGTVVSRDELLLNVWGYTTAPLTRTVDVHIALLRQKLERDPKNPELIVTVHSQGYRFTV